MLPTQDVDDTAVTDPRAAAAGEDDNGCATALAYLRQCDTGTERLKPRAHHLAQLVHLLTARFTDSCSIDLLNADGSVQRFSCFGAADHIDASATATLPSQAASSHCMKVPLSDGLRIHGSMLFVRQRHRMPFHADDLLDAKRLASRVLGCLLRSVPDLAVVEQQKRFSQASAILAHELRNPLGVIRNAIDLLSIVSTPDHDLHRVLNDQVRKMARLIDDLLEMSRYDCGKTQLRKERCQLQPMVKSVLQGLDQALTARCQRVEVAIAEEPVYLDADPLRISQILINLLSNASKYSGHGSTIRLDVRTVNHWVEIHVIDQGVGIAAEDLPNVFEFFSQSASSLDHSEGGLGIGLALVRRLAELHDGSVEVLSGGPDQGSEFIVRLPIRDAASAAPAPHTQPPGKKPRRVLIVDDRPDNQFLLSALIQKVGPHETQAAADGHAALEAMEDFQPDVVFLDIGMPGMNGLEVASRIRRSGRYKDVLIVAVTGYDSDELRQQALEAGFDVFQLKPASIDTIRTVLNHPKLAR